MMSSLAERQLHLGALLDLQSFSLGRYQGDVDSRIAQLEQENFCGRLWRKDGSLWNQDPKVQQQIKNALGWLHVPEKMEPNVGELNGFLRELKDASFEHAVHMGMGGSSLAPLAFQKTFAPGPEGLALSVLDTTDPATIKQVETRTPLEKTLFIAASKSGTTAEPLAFLEYFYGLVKEIKGDKAGENFAAITDPGSSLAALGKERGFRRVFLNFTDIGGRYSALSYFGLVPAALMAMDVERLLQRAGRMLYACASCIPARENPGVVLGAVLGELAKQGRDKVTYLVPQAISYLGMWLEQLLAESTGKEGTGLLPVALEPAGLPQVYGDDRVFAYLRLEGAVEEAQEQAVEALEKAGQPVVTIQMLDRYDLGQEFYRWAIATATAGAVLGINAFDQPNVKESKDNTNRLLEKFQESGQLPEDQPALSAGPLSFYTLEPGATAAATLSRFFSQAKPGDYVALLAYLTESPALDAALESLRLLLRDRLRLATTAGYGPRYLHSTGQLHKGGPNTGLYLELTADDPEQLPIPGKPYSFAVLKRAQALGDLESLRRHGRRVLRCHLSGDPAPALATLTEAIKSALTG
jgi:glucose-6-phosphate isomerase